MLTIFIILILIGCLIAIGGTIFVGLLLGSGLIIILIPIILDVLITILLIKIIFRRKKKSKDKITLKK